MGVPALVADIGEAEVVDLEGTALFGLATYGAVLGVGFFGVGFGMEVGMGMHFFGVLGYFYIIKSD